MVLTLLFLFLFASQGSLALVPEGMWHNNNNNNNNNNIYNVDAVVVYCTDIYIVKYRQSIAFGNIYIVGQFWVRI